MSMTEMAQLGAQSTHADSTDVQMEQIRELLVGDIVRRADARIEALEARVRELEAEIGRRLDALALRIEALSTEQTTGRRSAFDELSRSVAELGERIRHLAQS